MIRGSKQLKVGEYTYNRSKAARNNNKRWYCSRYHNNCRAFVVTSKSGEIVELNDEHIHPPPKMYKVQGKYINIK